jgi:hypothetical protein
MMGIQQVEMGEAILELSKLDGHEAEEQIVSLIHAQKYEEMEDASIHSLLIVMMEIWLMEMAEAPLEQLKLGILVLEVPQQQQMYAQLFEEMAFWLHLQKLETMETLFSMMGVAIFVSLRADTIA